jgi:hypothetical protein
MLDYAPNPEQPCTLQESTISLLGKREVEDGILTSLAVTFKHPLRFSTTDNIPNSNSFVEAPRNKRSTSCGQCADSIFVALEA